MQSRFRHGVTAISLSPCLVEVAIFGGTPEWPQDAQWDGDFVQLSAPTVLRFGKLASVAM